MEVLRTNSLSTYSHQGIKTQTKNIIRRATTNSVHQRNKHCLGTDSCLGYNRVERLPRNSVSFFKMYRWTLKWWSS